MAQHNPVRDPAPTEAATRIAVDVTFLRMAQRPGPPFPAFPEGYAVVPVTMPSTAFYRYLYGTVGHDYCWWLRRVASDAELAAMLGNPAITLHVLYHQGEPAGFFELDARLRGEANISYFGLMPRAIGHRLGTAFLGAAIERAWALAGPQAGSAIRVNTCTADHPRALGGYIRAGFKPFRTVREIWNIPDRLGLPIPAHLRA